jgi:UDP-N-acetylglucosamine 3-dehydrogenase
MVRFGVIGAGGMGRGYAAGLHEIDQSQLVGVLDIDRPAAEEVAGQYGARVFGSADELLAEVDAVAIATPTDSHKEYAIAAARAGRQIICEKPMALGVADCEEMIEAAERAGVRLLIGQILRFFPEFVKAKELIDAGAIGAPAVIRTTRAGSYPQGRGGWFADAERSGGVVLDMLVHDFDWLRWTLGEPERLFAKGLLGRGLDHIDYALVTMRFRSGAIAHAEGSWAYHGPFRVCVEAAGDKGLIDFDNLDAAPVTYMTKDEPGRMRVTRTPAVRSAHMLEIEHFVDVIANGAQPRVQPEDGLKAVAMAQAALESIRTGRPVTLS